VNGPGSVAGQRPQRLGDGGQEAFVRGLKSCRDCFCVEEVMIHEGTPIHHDSEPARNPRAGAYGIQGIGEDVDVDDTVH